jgi:hypothetical protein
MKIFSKYIINKLLQCRKYIKEYESQPLVTVINKPNSRIVAIGDIHGDIELMISTLTIGGIIKETTKLSGDDYIELNIYKDNKDNIKYYKWIGGNTIVVQVGDQIDRCRYSPNCNQDITYDDEASDIEILLFFTNLHKLASKEIYGGAVYSLLGNHELMNSGGSIEYVSLENLKQLELKEGVYDSKDDENINTEIGRDVGNQVTNFENRRRHIFRREGILSKFLACTRYSILIVNRYLFVHGGVLGTFINYKDDTNEYAIFEIINGVIKEWLMNYNDENLKDSLNRKYGNNDLYLLFFKNYNYNINDFIIHTNSPFWTRQLGEIEPEIEIDDPTCEQVDNLTREFNLNGIIVGHTPQIKFRIKRINGTCSNKLYRVDVASSKAFGEYVLPAQVLEIDNDKKTVLIKSIK